MYEKKNISEKKLYYHKVAFMEKIAKYFYLESCLRRKIFQNKNFKIAK